MTSPPSNVVAFDVKHRDRESAAVDTRTISECRTITADRLGQLLQNLFTRVDDELFKLSDKADNITVQSMYFDAMRYMRRERDTIEGLYLQAFLERYDDFWQKRALRGTVQGNEPKPLAGDEFSLVEHETLEEDLAINTMVAKGNTLFHAELFALKKRFSVLLNGYETDVEHIPVDPAALCRSFETALKPQTLDLKVKLLIYKLFDAQLLSAFGPVYHELNAQLINAGILPIIAKSFRRPAGASADRGMPGEAAAEALDAPYLEAFHAMQSMLDGWRSQLGLPTYSAGLQPGGVVVNSGEVLNALSLLQQPGHAMADAEAGGSSGDSLKLYVTNQIGKLQPDGQSRPMGRLEEDIIDMVAMIFDFILDDKNLPDAVKAVIARLQIPVVKVAILEKSFFAKKNHPARALLNSLAQAGIGLDIVDSSTDNPIFRKIDEVVNRILHDFDQDVSLFSDLLEDFAAFLDKESQRSRLAEDRTRLTTQSKEQMSIAKRKVAYEIALRTNGREIPVAARSFLYNAWKDVMVLAYLRRDKDAGAWTDALELMDRLLWSVLPPANAAGRQEIVQAIPALLQSIRERLEGISFDPRQTEEVMKELEACHIACLRASTAPESMRLDTCGDVTIKDPELAEAILEIKGNLPDIDEISVNEIGMSGLSEEIVIDSVQPGFTNAGDRFAEQVRDLGIGEWIEFVDHTEKPTRAKLSWKSQVTSTYVFVNRRGIKVVELKLDDLAARLRLGAARIIENSTVPLMDRAMSALMQSLNNPQQKSDSPS